LGFEDGPNLYAYVHNSPLTHVDAFGLFSFFSDRPNNSWTSSSTFSSMQTSFANAFSSPRFQGSMQAFGGFCEMTAGTALSSSGWGAAIGAPLFIHGADQFGAGSYSLISGQHRSTATSLGLQKIGFSQQSANVAEAAMSLGSGISPKTFGSFASRTTPISSIKTSQSSIQAAIQTEKKFKPFTERYYRDNLKILTGVSPPTKIQAHHVFPQARTAEFLEKGINVHDPRYLTWWESPMHQRHAKAYSTEWDKFFVDHHNAPKEQFLKYGKELMLEYGFETNY